MLSIKFRIGLLKPHGTRIQTQPWYCSPMVWPQWVEWLPKPVKEPLHRFALFLPWELLLLGPVPKLCAASTKMPSKESAGRAGSARATVPSA